MGKRANGRVSLKSLERPQEGDNHICGVTTAVTGR